MEPLASALPLLPIGIHWHCGRNPVHIGGVPGVLYCGNDGWVAESSQVNSVGARKERPKGQFYQLGFIGSDGNQQKERRPRNGGDE